VRVPQRPKDIDEYLASLPAPERKALKALRRTIRKFVPTAVECISYGIPAFRLEGGVVAGFCARAEGLSYFPFSGTTFKTLGRELEKYDRTKSSLHFAVDRPLPETLVRKLIATRLAEIRGE
jgi:uncharacterized protein YdhG (YjbR/CyaY superfamily)